jgi:hypothetical protein
MHDALTKAQIEARVASLVAVHGGAEEARARAGVECAARLWRREDGDEAAFAEFCDRYFAPSGAALDALFRRLEANLEEVYGSTHRISRQARAGLQVDRGELLPIDGVFAAWDPYAHLSEDFFATKIAFIVRLNFPLRSLEEKRALGPGWSRRAWAEARLGDSFVERLPAALLQARSAAEARVQAYIASYNIHTAALRDVEGRLYDEDRALLMHWNMRDEIKARYGETGGLRRQRALYAAMERVVDGSIPLAAVDCADLEWDPRSNSVGGAGPGARQGEEGAARYAMMLELFRAEAAIDGASPDAPTLLARRFDRERELTIEAVEGLLESLFEDDSLVRAADRARALLGRPLEAFDVWWRGSGGAAHVDEALLDARTRALYPTAEAFGNAIPSILEALGFAPSEAAWLADRIEVDPARGSGHAMPAAMRTDSVRLRTRVGRAGMDYKGFNIAMHELGHNVEEVYSLHGIDEYFLAGVPNTAFTEAFAFVFQARDLEVLAAQEAAARDGAARGAAGGKARSAEKRPSPRPGTALADFWATCEIAGVGLVDIAVWRWLYAHPGAGAEELRQAVLAAAKDVWNRLFAPAFGLRDAVVLGVYAHMIEIPLYLADYPLGHLVAFQIEDYLSGRDLGVEMARMCRLGRLTPDEWMRRAVGKGLSAAPLLAAARKELDEAEKAR